MPASPGPLLPPGGGSLAGTYTSHSAPSSIFSKTSRSAAPWRSCRVSRCPYYVRASSISGIAQYAVRSSSLAASPSRPACRPYPLPAGPDGPYCFHICHVIILLNHCRYASEQVATTIGLRVCPQWAGQFFDGRCHGKSGDHPCRTTPQIRDRIVGTSVRALPLDP